MKQSDTTLDRVGRAFKEAFATTVSRIYLVSILVAFLALLASLPMPNLRLPRKGEGKGEPGGLASLEG
ncbi:hypothetical protein IHN59_15305 [Deinococcus sp. 23YEL01]|nr:hypothetical protein [Deinococcus sp. 23YEL01]